jgi:hypothetical protein
MDRSKAQEKMAAEQMKQQAAAQQQQGELEAGQHQREQEAHNSEQDQMKARAAHAAVAHESLKDSAKQFAAGTKPIGGVANPINSDTADE